MASSKAKTVTAYLKELPPERRAVLGEIRKVVNDNLPKGYTERMGYRMITWSIPLAKYPDSYNGQPLYYAGLAAQKNYNALYLMSCVTPQQDARLRAEFKKRGKKLDKGKSCIRFRRAEDLPLDVIADFIQSMPPKALIAMHESAHRKT